METPVLLYTKHSKVFFSLSLWHCRLYFKRQRLVSFVILSVGGGYFNLSKKCWLFRVYQPLYFYGLIGSTFDYSFGFSFVF